MKKSLLTFFVSLFAFLNAWAAGHVASITVNQNVSCFGMSDGSATASVSGGTGPFAYNWSNSATGTVLNNVPAGNYYCIVTDSSDMTVDTAFCTITQPSQINAVAFNSGPYCTGATISLIASGGGTYSWAGPNGFTSTQQNPTITNGSPGTYTVTVAVGSCVATATTTVNFTAGPIISVSSTGATCFGTCNGVAVSSASGGTSPYSYSWQPGGNFSSVMSNACAGVYTVTVTDAQGCVASNTVVISQPAPLAVALNPVAASGCNVCDGSISSSVSGGTPVYSYNWSGPNGFVGTSNSVVNLCSSNYMLTVTDANGCTALSNATVSNSAMNLSVSVAPDTCGSNTGHANASVTANQGNITYNWLPGGATTQAIYNLNAGTYTVTATDTTGCSATAVATIQNVNAPSVITTSSAASCGSANGIIGSTVSGGVAPYQYSLNGGTFGSASTFSNLASGTYVVTVQDAIGCQASSTQIVQNNGLALSTNVTPANCNNNTSGSATVYVSNGTPPYTYLWSNGATTQTISNVLNGQYTCIVADAAGCSGTSSATIWQASSLYVYYGYAYSNCGNNSLTANTYSGTPPFTYLWNPGGQTTQTISNIAPGGYAVTITDANGCSGYGYFYCYPGDYSIVQGSIYSDVNSNCVKDGSDYNLNYWYVMAQTGNAYYYGYVNNGNYTIYLPNSANTYTLTTSPSWYTGSPYYTPGCATTNTITTSGNCDTTNFDFRFDTLTAQDLKAYLYCGAARPGFTRSYNISYGNPGTVTMNGTLVMDIDPLLTFTGSTPPPSLVSGNHIEWNIASLAPAQWGWITVNATLPGTVPLGTPVHDSVRFDPIAGDILAANNYGSCSGIVTNSWDPNEKEVYSPQADMNGVIDTSGADLYYTVHFQNTGTDTAFTIVVRDTLSQYVDLATLEMLGASHNYSWSIQPGRCLTVTFNNILLVDSNMNEAMSHGFFHYKIHTTSNITAGNNIDNTAGIYFDFNAPVITNTVTTPVAITTGLASHNQLNAEVYPNPSNTGSVRVKLNASSYNKISFTLFDAHGRVVRTKNISNAQLFDVDLNDLSEGIYFYKVSNEKGEQSSGKIIVGK